MTHSDPVHRSRFQLFNNATAWSFSQPLSCFYNVQKGISFALEEPTFDRDFEFHASTLDWLPYALGAGATDDAVSRWQAVFVPRLERALSGVDSCVVALFQDMCGICGVQEFARLSQLDKFRSSTVGFSNGDFAASRRLLPDNLTKQEQLDCGDVLSKVASKLPHKKSINPNDVRLIFGAIHRLWDDDCEPNYSEATLVLSAELSNRARTLSSSWFDLMSFLFELERYASYESLLRRMRLVGTGLFRGSWLDVGRVHLSQLRATERCNETRLLDELFNLANGRMAPILMNEFGCVADGNHRLIAAWIWNILHHSRDCDWSVQDECFREEIARLTSRLSTNHTAAALKESVRCLENVLSNQASRDAIERNLRRRIASQNVSSVPVVPFLEYCSFAVEARSFEERNVIERFPPRLYKELCERPHSLLPHRACYHFADRIPLPWFSLVEKRSHGVQRLHSLPHATHNAHRARVSNRSVHFASSVQPTVIV